MTSSSQAPGASSDSDSDPCLKADPSPPASESEQLSARALKAWGQIPISTLPSQAEPPVKTATRLEGKDLKILVRVVVALFAILALSRQALRGWRDGRTERQANAAQAPSPATTGTGGEASRPPAPATHSFSLGRIAHGAVARHFAFEFSGLPDPPGGGIWRVEPGKGTPPQLLIQSSFIDTDPQISPDGKRIAFVSDRSGPSEIWIANNEGGDLRQVSHFGYVYNRWPRWSPDGHLLLVEGMSLAEERSGVYAIDLDHNTARFLIDGAWSPSWSRNGKWIYYCSNNQIQRAPATGGVGQPITTHGGLHPWASADDQYIYFTKPGQRGIWRIPAAGGKEEMVIANLPNGLLQFWTVSATGLYWMENDGINERGPASPDHGMKLMRFDPRSKATSTVADMPAPAPSWQSSLSVAPDATWALFARPGKKRFTTNQHSSHPH